ncbi:hypothetical protein Tco_0253370, partial [Tanacetum coccineum]
FRLWSYGYDDVDVMMAMSVKEQLNWIMDSEGLYHITYMRYSLVDLEEHDGGNILLGDGKECRVRGEIDQEYIEGWEAVRRISDWVEEQDG